MCVCVCVCVRARVCAVCSVMSDSLSDSTQTVACQVHGISVHGILQARIVTWVAISFSRGSS